MKKLLPLLFSLFTLTVFVGCKKEEPSRIEKATVWIQGAWTVSWVKTSQYNNNTGEEISTYEGPGSNTTYTFNGTKANMEGVLLDFPYTMEEKNGKLYINAFDRKSEIKEISPDKMSWYDVETDHFNGTRFISYMDFVKIQ